ncbi:MAG TPA: ATP-binding protein [Candidatus Polarisedimenticolaceae bacterium]|nr:ATP-binding protein [Candidatus Polarisedimenticolaceae bacterium]
MRGDDELRAVALQNAKAIAAARQRAESELRDLKDQLSVELEAMTRLQQVGSFCARPGVDFAACLGELLEAAIALTGADKGHLQLVERNTGELRIAVQRGFEEPFLSASARGMERHSGRRVAIEEVSEKSLLEAGVRAVQATPLVDSSDRLLGILSTHYAEPHRFSASEMRRMDLLARQGAEFLERRQSEAALRRSESRLRAVFEQAGVGMALLAEEGRLLSVNERYCGIAGRHERELIGRLPDTFIHRDELPRYVEMFRSLRQGGLDTADFETRLVRGDGRAVWINISIAPIRNAGASPSHYFAVVQDIDARKLGELLVDAQRQALQLLADGAPRDAILGFLIDAVEQHQPAKGLLAAILPLNEAGTHFERGIGRSMPPAFHAAIEGAEIAVAQRGALTVSDFNDDERARGYGELVVPHGIRSGWSAPIVSGDGAVLGTYANFYREPGDPTPENRAMLDVVLRTAAIAIERQRSDDARERLGCERLELLAAERAARVEAERAGRLKDEFLATLSHELRTPIQAVVGWAQVLQRQHRPEDLRVGLEAIERNSRVQAQLIADLLDMSRIVSGKLRLEVRTVDFRTTVDDAIDTVHPAAQAKEIRIHKEFDLVSGSVVRGDPGRLQQVVWNLLNNAVKFTPRGGRILVRLERAGSQVELRITDTGPGIPTAFLPHVFERFRQADPSTNRQHGGLGLGLAIVRSILEAHGGSVRADSTGAGEGTTFIVSLPAAVTHLGDEGAQALPTSEVDLHGVRILVVDDESDARTLFRRVLEDAGALVATAADADDALRKLQDERPDVVMSDIGMPGKDGYELIRAMRELDEDHGGRTPAIALTAFARVQDRTRAMLSGYQVHLTKPVEAAELCAAVASLSGRARPRS